MPLTKENANNNWEMPFINRKIKLINDDTINKEENGLANAHQMPPLGWLVLDPSSQDALKQMPDASCQVLPPNASSQMPLS